MKIVYDTATTLLYLAYDNLVIMLLCWEIKFLVYFIPHFNFKDHRPSANDA